mgnify:CR=1 FL=1
MAILRTIFTGLLAILPIALTIAIIGWVANLVGQWLSRESFLGKALARLGGTVVHDETLALLIGAAIVIAVLYFIGLVVQTRLARAWRAFLDGTVGRLPLVGTIYKTLARFVGLLDRKQDVDVQAMSPVWCYFSDERRTAVLGLLPTGEPMFIEGEEYRVVMVPTAPVPFGGGLFFLPADWVRPAPFGVEGLTNIYVSMGVTAPDYLRKIATVGDDAAPVLVRRSEAAPPPGAAGT